MDFIIALSLSLLASLTVAVGIIMTQRLHGHLSMDNQGGVQKLHLIPTPRVGGISLAIGAVIGGFALRSDHQSLWWMICLSAIPAFAAGLIEDLTKRVGVATRLLATIFAGYIFCTISGYRIDHVNIPGVDWVLSFWIPSVLFTAFAIGGIANALNIIDGVNGLASGTAIIILSGFAVIGWTHQDMMVVAVCLVSIGALFGFFLTNFPMGRLFLGDAGAYTVGFLLAVIAVVLPARNPSLSPLIGLLALSYPVIETMVSIHRRTVRNGSNPGQPDRLHLHSLVYRSLSRRLANAINAPQMRNPMTSLIMWCFPLLTAVLSVICANSSEMILLAIVFVAMVYLRFYRRVALLRKS